jgi:hypothetical protein
MVVARPTGVVRAIFDSPRVLLEVSIVSIALKLAVHLSFRHKSGSSSGRCAELAELVHALREAFAPRLKRRALLAEVVS